MINRYDVCIVGAGIAGSLIAERLARRGARVALIEAGRQFALHERLTNVQRSRIVGGPVWPWALGERDAYVDSSAESLGKSYALNELRVKGVGGSSLHWGGLVQRLRESDFRVKSTYGMGSDWPIDYSLLEPWYAQAEVEIGVSGDPSEEDPPRSTPFPMPGFPPAWHDSMWMEVFSRRKLSFGWAASARNSVPYRGRSACVAFKICRACPSGARYSGDFHADLAVATGRCDLLTETVARRIEFEAAGRVKSIHATRLDGSSVEIVADQYVIAAHAVESARLMLLSGMGRYLDQIGRNLQEHWYLGIGGYQSEQLYPGRIGFNTLESNALYEGPERQHRGAIKIELGTGARDPLREGLNQGLIGKALLDYDAEHFGKWLSIGAELEHQPNPVSRVTLDASGKDLFGDPVPHVHFAVSEVDRATNERAKGFLLELLADRGVKEPKITQEFGPGGHHMGTLRMGKDPGDSVTDADCRVHGFENLFVAGSSLFTTSGARQPTLTIAALALRLAEHISQRG